MADELIDVEESRSQRKRRAIVEAATTAFLQNGYLGTSMDEIASLAAVSKQTVYKRFADKETLFREVVVGTVDQISDPNAEQIEALKDSDDLTGDLRKLARSQLERVLQPRVLQLRRLVIGEAGRFPELGRTFYERGPGRTIEALARAFTVLAERGRLQLKDPELAAQHFNWLIMSIPLNRAMFSGDDAPPSAAERNRDADAGVKVFLAAYGQP
jgi:TetR/AcrR family transcriptional repressor of mexJK operon